MAFNLLKISVCLLLFTACYGLLFDSFSLLWGLFLKLKEQGSCLFFNVCIIGYENIFVPHHPLICALELQVTRLLWRKPKTYFSQRWPHSVCKLNINVTFSPNSSVQFTSQPSKAVCMQTFHNAACSSFDNLKALDIIENLTLINYLLQNIS